MPFAQYVVCVLIQGGISLPEHVISVYRSRMIRIDVFIYQQLLEQNLPRLLYIGKQSSKDPRMAPWICGSR